MSTRHFFSFGPAKAMLNSDTGKYLLRSAGVLLTVLCSAQVAAAKEAKPQDTEVWKPEPAAVSVSASGVPSDAIVLFDGKDMSAWKGKDGGPSKWLVKDGAVTVVPGTGGIATKQKFCDIQLHIEWRSPKKVDGKKGQHLGNSGIFLQGRYEVQVLDSYKSQTYANGQAGSIYKQHAPLVNAMKPTGEWQSYDIIFSSPRFSKSGELEKKAYVTVLHNGVLIQNHAEIQGPTAYIGKPPYKAHDCGVIWLQDHTDEVSFRNIWLREL